MKKIIVLLFGVFLFSILFTACSGDQIPATVSTSGFFFEEAEITETQDIKKFHVTVKGDNAWTVAGVTLGDSTRWGEMVVKSPKIGNKANEKFFVYLDKYPGLWVGIGDTLWLPSDAINCQSLLLPKKISLNTNTSLEDHRYTKIEDANSLPLLITEEPEKSNGMPEWLQNLLWILLALLALGAVYWILRRLLQNPQETTSVTESRGSVHNHYWCDGCNCLGPCSCGGLDLPYLMDSMGNAVPFGKLTNTIWAPNGQPMMSTEIDNTGAAPRTMSREDFEDTLRRRLSAEFSEEEAEEYRKTISDSFEADLIAPTTVTELNARLDAFIERVKAKNKKK